MGYRMSLNDVRDINEIPNSWGLLWQGISKPEGYRAWDISIYSDKESAIEAWDNEITDEYRGVALYHKTPDGLIIIKWV